jgi:hypothetical protein
MVLPGFSHRDLVAILIQYNEEGAERHLVVCSAYISYNSEEPPPSKEFEDLMRYCETENLYLVVGCDSNAHHSVWGSTNCNSRGEVLVEFLNSSLEILNRGNEPTFYSGGRLEVIDITLGSLRHLESIIDWEVSSEPSLSDHRHILFTLRGSFPARLIRNPRDTNWGSFIEDLRDWLERGPRMNMKDEAGLGLAIHWVQQALISAYEDNCPLRPVKTGRQSLKWMAELESLRRGVRRLFNKCRSDKNPQSWALYREAQRNYRKEVRKASKNAWRTFCSSINDLPRSARLQRALSRDPKIKLGSLVAPLGRHTQSEVETLELLLTTYFPNSEITWEPAASVAALRLDAPTVDWPRGRLPTEGWTIDSFAPYKSPGVDGIFPALLQKAPEVVIPYLVRILHACLSTGYSPAIWQQVKVVLYLSPVGIRIVGLEIIDPSVSHRFFLKPRRDWWIGI